jgi:hypothetical protein
MSHYGNALQAGVGYLKGFPELADAAQDGITQDDLDAAMDIADTMVEALFADEYVIDDWLDAPPPLVARLWELLAAAQAISFRDLRLGLPGDNPQAPAARLERAARELINKLLHGWPERLALRDADGRLLRPKPNRAITHPRAAQATSDHF